MEKHAAGRGVRHRLDESVGRHGIVLDEAIGSLCASPIGPGLIEAVQGSGGKRLGDYQEPFFEPRVGQRDRSIQVNGPVADRFQPPVGREQRRGGGPMEKSDRKVAMSHTRRHKSTLPHMDSLKLEIFSLLIEGI